MSWLQLGGYASGLICFCCYMGISNKYVHRTVHVICNPSTGQCASLPKLTRYREESRYNKPISFLGFDPIDKQFKVLCMADPYYDDDHRIMTLGTEEMSLRKIQCPLTHHPSTEKGICIDGVLYYMAQIDETYASVIVCFDVKSEEYKFIEAECFHASLINYNGKLGGIHRDSFNAYGGRKPELHMWVLEDAGKQELSKSVYTLENDKFVDCDYDVSVVGVTTTGEIVLSMRYTSEPFYVFYFNPEKNTLQSVEISSEGFTDKFYACNNEVYTFVDHVEDLNFNITKTTCAATSISPPEEKRKPTSTSTSSKAHMQQDRGTYESTNKFDAAPFR